MTAEQHQRYGSEMLDTLVAHWPEGERVCYSENHEDITAPDGVVVKDLLEIPGCTEFLHAISYLPIFKGVVDGKRYYTHDINAFSRKAFAQMDAAIDYDGILIWLDADTKTLQSLPELVLEQWIGGNFVCVMKRKTWHLCSSFVMWDCGHAFSPGFWQHYFNLYTSGSVLTLPQWDDAFVLERCIESLEGVNDIAADITGEGPYNVFDKVFDGVAVHYKGNSKPA